MHVFLHDSSGNPDWNRSSEPFARRTRLSDETANNQTLDCLRKTPTSSSELSVWLNETSKIRAFTGYGNVTL